MISHCKWNRELDVKSCMIFVFLCKIILLGNELIPSHHTWLKSRENLLFSLSKANWLKEKLIQFSFISFKIIFYRILHVAI